MFSNASANAKGVIFTSAWMAASLAVLICNKEIYSSGFKYPLLVTGLGQLFSCVGASLLVKLAILPMPYAGPTSKLLRRTSPVCLAFAGSLWLGNYAFVYLSIAFVQMLKAFTPAITLLLCIAAGVERFSPPLLLAVLLIGLGTGATVLVEQSAPSFHLLGFIAFMLSAVSEAVKTVSSQLLLSAPRSASPSAPPPPPFTPAHAMIYISGSTAALLLGGSLAFEAPALAAGGLRAVAARPSLLLSSLCCSFAANWFNYLAVKHTSSVTTKVAGCIKNIGAALWGVVMYGELVTPLQGVGYLVSLGGVGLYSWQRSVAQRSRRPAPQDKAAKQQ